MQYEFGHFRLDARRRLLFARNEERPISLPAKAFDTLLYLIEHRETLLDKRTLLETIWPRSVVEENNLNQAITTLRRALGERRGDHQFIVTVPGRGYRFVAEVREAVSKPEAVTVAPRSTVSVAVLPFLNMTGDPGLDYLGDGLSEELIHKLTRVPDLHVPARTSSFAYKNKNVNVRDIARDLNVSAVLEGSVRGDGERIRVTAQLVDARSGFHVWSEIYDRNLRDIFDLEDELATAIVGTLQGESQSRSVLSLLAEHPTADVEAYHLYLQGRALVALPYPANLRRALQKFEEAFARDPSFARAMSSSATGHISAGMFGVQPYADAISNALRDADKALTIDSNLGDALAIRGIVLASRCDWVGAEEEFAKANNLSPDLFLVAYHNGPFLGATGRLRAAIEGAERVRQSAPAYPLPYMVLAAVNGFAGRDDEASRYADRATELGYPASMPPLPFVRAQVASRQGRFDDAATHIMQGGLPISGLEELVRRIYAAYGDETLRAGALNSIRELVCGGRATEMMSTMSMPMLLVHWSAKLGDIDLAYRIAHQALDHFGSAVPVSVFVPQLWLPDLLEFRCDRRFMVLATRLNLPAYWQRYGAPDDCELVDGQLICR